jgi:hypothetical protein
MALTYVALAGSRADLTKGDNIGTDQWAFALTTAIPGSTAFVSGTTDLTTSGGYTAGGANVATTSSTESAGTLKLILAAPAAWTASGAGFTFRYILLVDKTTNTIPGYWDYGSAVVMNGTNGDTFTFTPDATNGVFTVT